MAPTIHAEPDGRTKFRKEANAADNKGATVAVDSLINFEAVKVSLFTVVDVYIDARLSTTKSTRWRSMTPR